LTALTLYRQLRERRLVRLDVATSDNCPPIAKAVRDHPECKEILKLFHSGELTRRKLAKFNFRRVAQVKLRGIVAYLEWVNRSRGSKPPTVNPEPILVAIGSGDKSSGGRKRQTRTIGSQQAHLTHGIWLGERLYSLGELEAISREAPNELVRALLGGDAGRLPIEPTEAILEAVEWLGGKL
jgi:hypothetical protein